MSFLAIRPVLACQAAVNERPYKYHAEHLASSAKLVSSQPCSSYQMWSCEFTAQFYNCFGDISGHIKATEKRGVGPALHLETSAPVNYAQCLLHTL